MHNLAPKLEDEYFQKIAYRHSLSNFVVCGIDFDWSTGQLNRVSNNQNFPLKAKNKLEQPTDERALRLLKYNTAVVPFFFEPMLVRDGDWLKTFRPDGHALEEYVLQDPTLLTDERTTIYIQPIGSFSRTQTKFIELTAEDI